MRYQTGFNLQSQEKGKMEKGRNLKQIMYSVIAVDRAEGKKTRVRGNRKQRIKRILIIS